jgi:Divergent InlB B-repeat domain
MRGKTVVCGGALLLGLVAFSWPAGRSVDSAERLSVHDSRLRSVSAAVSTHALPAARARARASAAWCGASSQADLTPNMLAGYPVHWIYAVPADGQDLLSTFASAMQTDAEAIDAWWRTQDATRVPRNDVTQFSCGVQLDVSTLRLQQSSAELTAFEGRFGALFEALNRAGFNSRFTKYLIYFDGPVAEQNICGQGGSDPSGFGFAVVYAQACSGVSTAAVAAHELLHTFGAVPFGAPHECPPPDEGHTCDDPSDLMHPSIGAEPLSAKILDPGREDYYGHGEGFPDAQDSPWLLQLDRQVPFTVTISGPGAVAADVPGLQCTQTCTTTWNSDTQLALTASPGAGAKLVRWGGGCGGASACNLRLTPGGSVTALFAPLAYRLTVSVGGRGTVRTSRPGITCRPRCSAAFPSYVPVRLTAKPARGWRFRTWSGACRGSRPVCSVPMTAATRARAVFGRA